MTLMNKNENFKEFLRQRFPSLDVDTAVEAFQYWLSSGGDYRELDLDDYENAQYDVLKWREEE